MSANHNPDAYSDLKARLDTEPMIMGVLNITPDSFSDGGRYTKRDDALRHALRLIDEGADIIDIGGESSRPGAEPVSAQEEMDRVIPVIEEIRATCNLPLSIDTYKATVAGAALDAGVNWVNDISGLRFDPEMAAVVKQHQCPVVIMHMLGEPRTMQKDPSYHDVIGQLKSFFRERVSNLEKMGITRLIIDPGIGFGKRLEDNLLILRHLDQLTEFACPLMIGVSRKSFIGTLTSQPVTEREAGTLAANIWCYQKGARIFRTHMVRPLKNAFEIIKSIAGNVNLK